MSRVLVVSTAFPFPPRSGFETRVYQLLRQIAKRHEATLLSAASPEDESDAQRLRGDFPVETVVRRDLGRRQKRRAQARSLLSLRSYHSRIFDNPEFQAAVDRLCAETRFDVVQLESSLLCSLRFPESARVVLDEHNIEYEVFARMRESERSLARRSFYRLEQARFRRFEEQSWRDVDACVVTSAREAAIVRAHASETRTAVVANAVDLEFFRRTEVQVVPRTMVFNGVLDYRPNLDAALHLVDDILPLVQARFPDATLEIVGRGADEDLRSLERPGVSVTGEVPDVRPHLARAAVEVVPIRMGGGTRLKIVEGLAMEKPIVTTTLGCEGIDVAHDEHLLVADGADAFAAAVCSLFDAPERGRELGVAGRRLVEEAYSWDRAGALLEELYREIGVG